MVGAGFVDITELKLEQTRATIGPSVTGGRIAVTSAIGVGDIRNRALICWVICRSWFSSPLRSTVNSAGAVGAAGGAATRGPGSPG